MDILARQLTIDLYNCNPKKLTDIAEIKTILNGVFDSEPSLTANSLGSGHIAIIGAFPEGHIALHVYSFLRYVAVDIFTCAETSRSEELEKTLRKFFQPDKIKSTFLKRGDFGQEREIKPKTKTRVAPFRRVRNVGAKVVRKLVRRDS